MNFGDSRSDVHPGATLLHTAFLRSHNRIATFLAKVHPDWSDETIFQETRKINIAIYQNIVYTEFMNALLGDGNDVQVTAETGFFSSLTENKPLSRACCFLNMF
jgi:hypothetical protein